MNRINTDDVYIRCDTLCRSLAGNAVPLITVTGSIDQLSQRDTVVLMARVHPGETNASWIMHGIIQFLTSARREAQELRRRFVFKLIPMMNPDGVINGCNRFSLAGVDLNRVWDRPSKIMHPSVYWAKGLIQYMTEISKRAPFVVVDIHGHSRLSNVILYGNNPNESWRSVDQTIRHDYRFLELPSILGKISNSFSLSNCRYTVTKSKEPTARVVLWRQFQISRCYTLESTYCGYDSGPYTGCQIGISELKEIGHDLCMAILNLHLTVTMANSEHDNTS